MTQPAPADSCDTLCEEVIVRNLFVATLVAGLLTGHGAAAQSPRSAALTPRTADADRVVHSVCPYIE